jgi:pyruvate kinase
VSAGLSGTVDGGSADHLDDARTDSAPVTAGMTNDAVLATVAEQIHQLRERLVDAENLWATQIASVDETNLTSAVNLAHYWAIRQCDLRELQLELAAFGLSSLGRCEPHVQATLEAIAATVEALLGQAKSRREPVVGFGEGPRLLRRRAVQLFGPEPADRQTRIMVTLPAEAASDPTLVLALVEDGMNLARINCAHDGIDVWAAMIGHVRAASAATGRECLVAMDLSGPKVRTGPLTDGPRVIKLRPTRDKLGRVTAPARCWLTPAENPVPPPHPGLSVLQMPESWLNGLCVEDRIEVADTRGARRHLVVETTDASGTLIATWHTAYIATGTVLRTRAGEGATVGTLPPLEQFLTLRRGESLTLTRDCSPAPVTLDAPARIGCTLTEAFGRVQPGHAVHLDDGKLSGEVIAADDDQFTIRMTNAAINGSRLRAAKGINLPDTVLPIPALTTADRANLPFIIDHADLVELSFARDQDDVQDLLTALNELGDARLGVVVKVDKEQAFQHLPAILITALRRPHTGVMIARGDLAGECGYDRLAELQEEILWLCEAAHLPVIWATQVLDQLARTGRPSRAEITDAAMGVRAECVMLNKGPHILDAVTALADILHRMTGHHDKKNSLLRPLRSWRLTAEESARDNDLATPRSIASPIDSEPDR